MNTHPTRNAPRHLAVLAAAALALSLGACSKNEDRTVGQQIDSAIAKSEQKADEAKAEVKSEMADAKAAAERATDRVTQTVETAADKVSASVGDAAVTASINAALARDPSLSALKIDVDTHDGRVMLTGKAPDASARDRATVLASGVKGVTHVDNRLQIGS